MPNKDKNIPKRRFKEFENADAWELRKLGEVVYRSNLISSSKDLPRLEFEDINSGLGTLNKDISQKLDYRKGLEFNVGDVLFGKLRPYLKNWWYAEFKGIALGDFWNLKSDLWHSCFLYTYIQSNSFQLVANDTSGTKMPRSDWNLVAESIAKFPSLPEQEAIGTFFSTLDCHITLHQRKLDKLKSVKQAYLSEMFPAEGERVPKRRFPGFTDDWELRKFDECFNFPVSTNSLSRALLNYDEGDIKSVHYGDILIKYPAILNIKNDKIPYITGGKLEKYKSSLLENGDLIFADAAEDETVGKAVEVNGLTEENLVAGLHTIVARPKDKKAEFFLGYYINSNTYHRQLLRLIQGSKVSSISKGNLQKTLVSFPKDFEEQQKIGAFFKKIDDTITLHQRKSI